MFPGFTKNALFKFYLPRTDELLDFTFQTLLYHEIGFLFLETPFFGSMSFQKAPKKMPYSQRKAFVFTKTKGFGRMSPKKTPSGGPFSFSKRETRQVRCAQLLGFLGTSLPAASTHGAPTGDSELDMGKTGMKR